MNPSSVRPSRPRRISRHLRRNLVAYVALAGMVALSPAPSIAADLVTTGDIADGAVTRPKLAEDSVNSAKVANGTISGADLKSGTVADPDVADLEWHEFTLINGWTNANGSRRPPAWAVDVQGITHLRGAIEGGYVAAFARLPVEERPKTWISVSATLIGRAPGGVTVNPEGYLQVDYEGEFADAAYFTSLEGVTWAQ